MADTKQLTDVNNCMDETDNIQQPQPCLPDLPATIHCQQVLLSAPFRSTSLDESQTKALLQEDEEFCDIDKEEDNKVDGTISLLKKFDLSTLRKTETKTTTVGGKEVIEGRDENGVFVVQKVMHKSGRLGYVADTRQDLQVGEVLPGLIIGSQDVAHNLELLKSYKITHILNCGKLIENLYPYKYKYKNIELYDLPQTPILRYFTEAMEFMHAGRKSGCVLVHCNAGVSRSATFVIAYLMKSQMMSFKEAYNHLRSKRPATCPNPGFVSQLKKYEQILKRVKQSKKGGKSRASASC